MRLHPTFVAAAAPPPRSRPRPKSVRAFGRVAGFCVAAALLIGVPDVPASTAAFASGSTGALATTADPVSTARTAMPGPELVIRIPTLQVPGDSTSGEDPSGSTSDIAVTPDGKYAYATSATDNRLFVFDLDERIHTATLRLGGGDAAPTTYKLFLPRRGHTGAVLEAPGRSARAYIIDTAHHRVKRALTQHIKLAEPCALSPTGSFLFCAAPLPARIMRVNLMTGGISMRALPPPAKLVSSISMSADGKQALVSAAFPTGTMLQTFRVRDLVSLRSARASSPSITRITSADPHDHAYAVAGNAIVKLDTASGRELGRLACSEPPAGLVADPLRDNAWVLTRSGRIVPADFSAHKVLGATRQVQGEARAIAQRPLPHAANGHNPGVGDIVVSSGPMGSGMSIVLAPAIIEGPANARTSHTDKHAHFSARIDGVPAQQVVWQESVDGHTWADIRGSTGAQLAVAATHNTVTKRFRAAYTDAFWGVSGATRAVHIIAPKSAVSKSSAPLADAHTAARAKPLADRLREARWRVGRHHLAHGSHAPAAAGGIVLAATAGLVVLVASGSYLASRRHRERTRRPTPPA